MPSASLVRSLPVPLGRRGTAAAVVLGLHVLLAIALVLIAQLTAAARRRQLAKAG